MKEEERLRRLEQLRESLVFAIEDVDKEIGELVSRKKRSENRIPDSFSEEKEKFIAP